MLDLIKYAGVGLLALGIVVVFVLAVFSAPAPRPRRQLPKEAFVGDWQMTWAGMRYQVAFRRDGFYACTDGQSLWLGRWQYVDGRLEVHEALDEPNAPEKQWVAHVEPGVRRGRLEQGGPSTPFALEPLRR